MSEGLKATLTVLFGLILSAVIAFSAVKAVQAYNADYRHNLLLAEQKDEDRRLCRGMLGFDYDVGQRKLMMACAQEVIERDTAKGIRRSDAATTAWKTCMPNTNACERALRE